MPTPKAAPYKLLQRLAAHCGGRLSARAWHRRRARKNRRRHDRLVLNTLPLGQAIKAIFEFEKKRKWKWSKRIRRARREYEEMRVRVLAAAGVGARA